MFRYLLILCGLAMVTFASASAFACKCEVSDRDSSYKRAKAVFLGETSEDGSKITVVHSYKGTKKKRKLEIKIEDSCDSALEGGKRYMVYAKKTSKKTVRVDACSATEQVDFKPLTGQTWSYGEELPYGTSRSVIKKHAARRAALEKVAMKLMRSAAKSCAKETWHGKDKVSALIRVRFDVKPSGESAPVVLKYEPANKETEACLQESLTKAKFKKFPGGPLSVRTYWMLNRIDKKMKQEKRGSQVIPYKKVEDDTAL